MHGIDWKRTAAIVISVCGGAFLLYVLCTRLFVLLLPFLLAFLLAAATRSAVKWLAKRTGCPLRVSAVLVTLSALLALGIALYFLCHRLFLELQRLMQFLITDGADENGRIARLFAFFRGIGERVPFLSRLQEIDFIRDMIGDPRDYLVKRLEEAITRLASGFAGTVADLLRRLPGVLLFLLVWAISCFYFALDYEKVVQTLVRLLPSRVAQRVPEWRVRATVILRKCIKAYFLLFLLTLGELMLGFLLLRVEYPFLLALLAAALDILPVFGVGAVLLPWSLFCLLTGEVLRGVGLLVLYALVTVIRQIAEPHLVGKSLGMHPLLLLVAFYVGIRLFGVVGLLLGPLLGFVGKAFFEHAQARSV